MKKNPPATPASKKRELTPAEKDECGRLNDIYQQRKRLLREKGFKNQSDIGEALGMKQAAVSHYLNGINSLNKEVALKWAKLLDIDVEDFSPRLANELREISAAIAPSEQLQESRPNYRTEPHLTNAEREVIEQIRQIPAATQPQALAAIQQVLSAFVIVNQTTMHVGAGPGNKHRAGGRDRKSGSKT